MYLICDLDLNRAREAGDTNRWTFWSVVCSALSAFNDLQSSSKGLHLPVERNFHGERKITKMLTIFLFVALETPRTTCSEEHLYFILARKSQWNF
jgi:hypothetical protein